ncbi:MAG: ribosomal protein S18-alanine N-acetyltransferase [Syntrophobacterales bacterium]|nr:ribosomal protein S18-alanine N-acetyltransferase [Syntrophobacterales bacterium]
MDIDLRIRAMEARDIKQLGEIEGMCFLEPYSSGLWKEELCNSLSRTYVAVDNVCKDLEDIVGYVNFWIVLDEAELHRLAVKETHRRRGVAGALLNVMFAGLRQMAVKRVRLEVRTTNLPAIAFYHQHGFVTRGRRTGYYGRARGEDALIMERKMVP